LIPSLTTTARSRWDKALTVLLVVAVLGAIGSLVYVTATPRVGERFTEFYILGPQGKAEDYPKVLVLGEKAVVRLGIVNHEHETTDYRVEITIDGEKVSEIGSIALKHEGKWEQPITFSPTRAGAHQKVEFSLYKGEDTEPYRKVYLWITVMEEWVESGS